MALTLPDGAPDNLASEQIGWLTTVRGDQPQSSPVWFLWADETLWIRSQPDTGKTRNLAANPRVSFHLDTTNGGHVVTVEATAEDVDELPEPVRQAYAEKYRASIERDLGSTPEGMEADYPVVLRLRPTRVRGW